MDDGYNKDALGSMLGWGSLMLAPAVYGAASWLGGKLGVPRRWRHARMGASRMGRAASAGFESVFGKKATSGVRFAGRMGGKAAALTGIPWLLRTGMKGLKFIGGIPGAGTAGFLLSMAYDAGLLDPIVKFFKGLFNRLFIKVNEILGTEFNVSKEDRKQIADEDRKERDEYVKAYFRHKREVEKARNEGVYPEGIDFVDRGPWLARAAEGSGNMRKRILDYRLKEHAGKGNVYKGLVEDSHDAWLNLEHLTQEQERLRSVRDKLLEDLSKTVDPVERGELREKINELNDKDLANVKKSLSAAREEMQPFTDAMRAAHQFRLGEDKTASQQGKKDSLIRRVFAALGDDDYALSMREFLKANPERFLAGLPEDIRKNIKDIPRTIQDLDKEDIVNLGLAAWYHNRQAAMAAQNTITESSKRPTEEHNAAVAAVQERYARGVRAITNNLDITIEKNMSPEEIQAIFVEALEAVLKKADAEANVGPEVRQ